MGRQFHRMPASVAVEKPGVVSDADVVEKLGAGLEGHCSSGSFSVFLLSPKRELS